MSPARQASRAQSMNPIGATMHEQRQVLDDQQVPEPFPVVQRGPDPHRVEAHGVDADAAAHHHADHPQPEVGQPLLVGVPLEQPDPAQVEQAHAPGRWPGSSPWTGVCGSRMYLISPVTPCASAGPCRLTGFLPCNGTCPSTVAASGSSSPASIRASRACSTASAASVSAMPGEFDGGDGVPLGLRGGGVAQPAHRLALAARRRHGGRPGRLAARAASSWAPRSR